MARHLYDDRRAKVPTPTVCPRCDNLVNLWYRTDTQKPIALECSKCSWRIHLDAARKRAVETQPEQGELTP